MMPTSAVMKTLPLDIVGSTVFGRYPIISIEQTFNMIISDDWLVPYAGYKKVATIAQNGQGRGIYGSHKYQHLIAVIDNGVYAINKNNAYERVGSLETFSGDVFIDENNASQIGICDKSSIYIFDYATNTFQKASTPDFLPGYIAFQDGYFIAPDLRQAQWRLSDPNNGLSWPAASSNVGTFETKPDIPVAVIRFPGKGNLLLVFGSTVTEPWYDIGAQLFPYQRNSFFNIDYGCLNPATIASGENIVVWLGANEKSGPVIMYSTGADPQQISNDGINFRLAQLNNPSNAYGFLFKQDGHVIYQLTFPDDNLTLAYDFNTKRFFTLCDEDMNYHIAKRVVFFNDAYYFVSFKDGNLYELNSSYTTNDGAVIPNIRVGKTLRMPDSSRFIINNLTFPLEQGEYSDLQAVDFSFSKDNGASFSSYERIDLSKTGFRNRRINFWNKGMAINFTPQFRFWGKGRFVGTSGTLSYYQ